MNAGANMMMRRRKRDAGLRRRRGDAALCVVAAFTSLCIIACEPYRIEYVKHPEFHRSATRGATPQREVLPDGTVIVHVYGDEDESDLQRKANSKSEPFKIREEKENGEIILRAILPEHVLANTMTCLRNEEYEMLWEQMLSERTKLAYSQEGLDKDDFAQFFSENRQELARTLNRMILGLPRQEVVTDNLGNGVLQYRLVPQVAAQFKFRKVQIVGEGYGLKLLLIL